jgi:hypothetical protein
MAAASEVFGARNGRDRVGAVHFREAERLSIVQIADRLGRSPATIKAYFYDPIGEKTRSVKAATRGVPWLRCPDAAAQRQGRAYA